MDKKGQIITETAEWLWQILPTVIVAVFVFIIIFSYLNEDIQTQELSNSLINSNFIYSCLAKENSPGIIDASKFMQENLDSCFNKNSVGFSLTFRDQTINSKNTLYTYLPVCKSMKDFRCSEFENYVLTENNQPEILKVEVIQRVQ